MALILQTASLWHCGLAQTISDLDDVYRLRYRCYHASGMIPVRADERLIDPFDPLPNQFRFLVRDDSGEALATLRISVCRPDLGWTETPASHIFSREPAFQSLAAKPFVEANRLCFSQSARRDIFHAFLGNMAAMAERFGADWLIAAPRADRAEMYQRLYGFQPIAGPKSYGEFNFQTILLATRLSEIRDLAERASWFKRDWERAKSADGTSVPLPCAKSTASSSRVP